MKLFGTDGLRGRAGEFPLDPASVRLLGRELGRRLSGGRPARVVVGGDTRESTPRIVADLAAGLADGGCGVASAGRHHDARRRGARARDRRGAGVAVSASHNPYEDNGIKIFGPDGRKWPDEEEELLEGKLLAAGPAGERAADAGASRPGSGPRRDLRLAPAGEPSRRTSTGFRFCSTPATAPRSRSGRAPSSARARA